MKQHPLVKIVNPTEVKAEFARLGKMCDFDTIEVLALNNAIELNRRDIDISDTYKNPTTAYTDLTRYSLTDDIVEDMIVYDADAKVGRLLTSKEQGKYLEGLNYLTANTIRKFYANRKTESEYLVDSVGLFWVLK